MRINLSAREPISEPILAGWADSDWAGSCNCCKLTSGYIFAIDGLICSWSSRLQPTVANSSVEAEYVALAGAARELIWTMMFLSKLRQSAPTTTGIQVSAGMSIIHSHDRRLSFDWNVPVLYSDSSGACAIASNPQHFKRTKHIDIAHFFLWDEVASQRLAIALIQSSENLANMMTKLLAAPMLLLLCQLSGLTLMEGHAGLRGGVEKDWQSNMMTQTDLIKGQVEPIRSD